MEPSTGSQDASLKRSQHSAVRTTPLRLLIADPQRLVAEAIAARFRQERWAEVIAVATTPADVLAQANRKPPHVVLLEAGVDGWSAFDLCSKLRERWPDVRFVFLSSIGTDAALKSALDLSAGYLLKTESLDDVVAAIGGIGSDAPPFSSEIERRIHFDRKRRRYALKQPSSIVELTERQTGVLRLIALGRTSREIAEELGITTHGVESTKRRIMHKLGIFDRLALARYAFREGLVPP